MRGGKKGEGEGYYISFGGEDLDVAALGVAGVDDFAVPLACSGGEDRSGGISGGDRVGAWGIVTIRGRECARGDWLGFYCLELSARSCSYRSHGHSTPVCRTGLLLWRGAGVDCLGRHGMMNHPESIPNVQWH